MADPFIPVRVGACLCPSTPHPDGDFVYLRPILDLRAGFRVKRRLLDLNRAASAANGPPPEIADLESQLAEAYLDEGIAEWNLLDGEGTARPITPETLREFLYYDYGRAEAAADKADDLYRPAVLDPLVLRALNSLPAMPTNGLTSPTSTDGSKRPKRAKRSSTTTTPTASTEATT